MVQRKIKVLTITHSFPTKYNPIAAIFILNQLVELKKYCDIKVIFPHGYVPSIKFFNPYYRFSKIPNQEEVEGITVFHPKYFMIPRIIFGLRFLNIYASIESVFSYLSSRKIADKVAEEWNPDIIHMHGTLSEGWLVKRLKRKYDKPFLITVHGEDVTRYAKEMLSAPIVKSNLAQSDAIICQSKFLRKEIESIGIKNKKFFIIPMGAKLERFNPKDKIKAREKLNLPKNKKVILFTGPLIPRKGVEYLIRAVKLIIKKDKNIYCVVIGSGSSEARLKVLSSSLNLDRYINFIGRKTNDEVADYMNACDLFVLPSLNEGLPVVLCEALACGKPIVATKVAGTPELINKDVGYLVEPKNVEDLEKKILLALNKKWDKAKILQQAKNFSVAASARKLVSVYRSIIVK